MTAPERPTTLPAEATYDAEARRWELWQRGGEESTHRVLSTYRGDGTLQSRASYREGKLDGTQARFTDGTPGSEPLRACCVPPGARELRAAYRAGRMLYEVFYDAEGRALCDDGTPWPERPAGVPSEARYDETARRFVERVDLDDERATFRYFNLDGVVEDELDLRRGRSAARRHFEPDGTCSSAVELDEQARLHGAIMLRVEAGTYVDSRVREVRGAYEHGEPAGPWTYFDASGARLRCIELGPPLGAAAEPLVSGTEWPPAIDAATLWREAESRLTTSPRTALALAAQALGRDGDCERFWRCFDACGARMQPAAAAARTEEALGGKPASPSALLGALLTGAAPAVILRTLASSLAGPAPAALPYFDASLALAPEQAMRHVGRGLLCVEHGERDGALSAASALEAEAPETATSLRDFCRITYDAFAFAPARDGIGTPAEELVQVEAAQPLEAVRRVAGVYATRLLRVREELARRAARAPDWLPPELGALLPAGPVELRRYVASIEDEGEDGTELTEVEVDETLSLERSTRRLLVTARADWAALGWLAWCAGLDAVALPERLEPRANFAAAAHQATLRSWRAHDRLRTSGLVALARQVESFEWEGMPIDDVPPHLLDVAAAEYLEVRAQFLWQLFPENVSPFQSDLRRV